MSKVLLIDGNAIGYSCQAATKLTTPAGLEVQAVFGLLKTMRELRMKYYSYTPIVLWDGRAQWRYDLYPGYKGNREATIEKVEMKAAYSEQKPYIDRALRHLGVRQVLATTHEADDMAGYYVAKLAADPANEIGVITGDKDWLQFVRKNVFWRDMRDDSRIIHHNNFYEKTGCLTPLAFLETKCLQGDSSDTISGVGGIGEGGAPEFIAEFGSVREFWRQCDAGEHVPKALAHQRLWKGRCPQTKEEWTASFTGDVTDSKALKKHIAAWPGQGRDIFKRNFQLMQLLKVKPPKKDDLLIDVGKYDKEAFRELCAELSFLSILRGFDEFTEIFLPKEK